MPSLFLVFGYKIYFWANEGNEPVHVHVSKGKPSPSATKIWITRAGGTIVVNSSRIPKKDLAKIEAFVQSNAVSIVNAWNNVFNRISYYC